MQNYSEMIHTIIFMTDPQCDRHFAIKGPSTVTQKSKSMVIMGKKYGNYGISMFQKGYLYQFSDDIEYIDRLPNGHISNGVQVAKVVVGK